MTPDASRRGFRIRGLDCAEEVALPECPVGPVAGGECRLSLDTLIAPTTVERMRAKEPFRGYSRTAAGFYWPLPSLFEARGEYRARGQFVERLRTAPGAIVVDPQPPEVAEPRVRPFHDVPMPARAAAVRLARIPRGSILQRHPSAITRAMIAETQYPRPPRSRARGGCGHVLPVSRGFGVPVHHRRERPGCEIASEDRADGRVPRPRGRGHPGGGVGRQGCGRRQRGIGGGSSEY